MINLRNIFNKDTTVIGLTSLGLAKELKNNTQVPNIKKNTNYQNPSIKLNFTQKRQTDALDCLFDKNTTINYKNGKIIG